jgi:hypothetical protein
MIKMKITGGSHPTFLADFLHKDIPPNNDDIERISKNYEY